MAKAFLAAFHIAFVTFVFVFDGNVENKSSSFCEEQFLYAFVNHWSLRVSDMSDV